MRVQSKKPDTCNEFSRIGRPDLSDIFSLEENFSYVRIMFSQIKQ